MRNTGTSTLHYLLYALLIFALTGCGASNLSSLANPAGSNAPGSVSAKLVWGGAAGKTTAKTVSSVVPAGVQSIKFTVTGTGLDGNSIPVARSKMTGLAAGQTQASASVSGIYPGQITLTVQAMSNADGTGTVQYEGYALNVTVAAGSTPGNAGTIIMTVPVVKSADAMCLQCHETTLDTNGQNLISEYKQSGHYTNTTFSAYSAFGVKGTGCAGCHGPSHNVTNPATSGRCYQCHGAANPNHSGASGVTKYLNAGNNNCDMCHVSHNYLGAGGCLDCHSVNQNANFNGVYVNDNNGVRAVAGEFAKNAHHVYGKVLTNQDCAVCHMEGTTGGAINVAYHMKDNKIHLRNGNPTLTGNQSAANGAEYIWDPANPNHTAMDQFCMSCHNSGGAPAAVGLVAGNSAINPFNDAISNGYDQMARSAVVPVFNQFDTGNSSHHAVRGQKYSGRTRATTANPAAFTKYSGAAVNPDNTSANKNGNAGIGPLSPGSRYTLYEAGFFVTNYTPLGATASVADNSTLHCGDCHTVGQFKPNSTTAVTSNPDGTTTQVTGLAAIGAHGSNNEYLLRTSDGVDALHHQNAVDGTSLTNQNVGGTYVCYLCHRQGVYGSDEQYQRYAANPAAYPVAATYATARLGGHGGLHPCNSPEYESVGLTGTARVSHVPSVPGDGGGGGNLFGYTCAHCHNAGNIGFGGIHGNNATWGTYSAASGYASTSSTGVAITYRKSYRFMGGLSLRYNGGATAAKWESQTTQRSNREGCYNFTVGPAGLNATNTQWVVGSGTTEFSDGANADQTFGTWGACGQHNGSTTSGGGEPTLRKVQRPLNY